MGEKKEAKKRKKEEKRMEKEQRKEEKRLAKARKPKGPRRRQTLVSVNIICWVSI